MGLELRLSRAPTIAPSSPPAAHLTLDRRPVFRSGLIALWSQTPWLAFSLSFLSLTPSLGKGKRFQSNSSMF